MNTCSYIHIICSILEFVNHFSFYCSFLSYTYRIQITSFSCTIKGKEDDTMNKNLILWCIALIIIIVTYIFAEVKIPEETILYLSNDDIKKNGKMEIEDAREFYKNEDIIGYLDIPGTSIHFFFTQGQDNSFYLEKDLRKKKSKLGTIFMDYRNTLTDKQINLYGHNGNVEVAPFYELQNYKKREFSKQNSIIEIFLPKGEKRTYQIASVVITKDTRHMDLSKEKENIAFYNEESLYPIEPINVTDSLLVLQTCSYEDKNTYLLIISKEIKGDKL